MDLLLQRIQKVPLEETPAELCDFSQACWARDIDFRQKISNHIDSYEQQSFFLQPWTQCRTDLLVSLLEFTALHPGPHVHVSSVVTPRRHSQKGS